MIETDRFLKKFPHMFEIFVNGFFLKDEDFFPHHRGGFFHEEKKLNV